ncbi:hypothetical protein Bbelb_137110 [Branchiostoma belcheri]|nr:hypothetical protein Bbelb_137110 [Branchiostoma belcheri]
MACVLVCGALASLCYPGYSQRKAAFLADQCLKPTVVWRSLDKKQLSWRPTQAGLSIHPPALYTSESVPNENQAGSHVRDRHKPVVYILRLRGESAKIGRYRAADASDQNNQQSAPSGPWDGREMKPVMFDLIVV